MDNRVALIGIIVSDKNSVSQMNTLLHEYSEYIIGRMGVPYEKAGVSVISIALDAPQNVISALAGKLGALKGISSKTIYHKTAAREGT